MSIFIALIAGIIFGAGLLVSGMMDPEKVIGFLDLFGEWDPSLMFVMGSALIVTVPAFRLIMRRQKPIFNERFSLPLKTYLDKPLIVGAAIFGVGWGLYGYCPGPGISSLASLNVASFLFVPSMLAGMWLANKVANK
ncbi:DUF6691 family protein [Alkalimarinus alittae]|uniref:YeeE/YedE family protein n=1 Tax=Alkalimarinus alittae TaxID=2961619 RepID=A0ABY6N3K2_9ALTE|nr:DUF6691 family protein [Alkalimarinus alittae]UZE96648.1 YeeE/YedE family protein [Alkalimarinus alittae]